MELCSERVPLFEEAETHVIVHFLFRVGTLAHMIAAEALWQCRWTNVDGHPRTTGQIMVPLEVTIARV